MTRCTWQPSDCGGKPRKSFLPSKLARVARTGHSLSHPPGIVKVLKGRHVSDSSPARPDLTVSNAIRVKRERSGLSARELGKRAGLSAAYVSALESGNLNPSFQAFARLAIVLRFTPAEIFFLVQTTAQDAS